MRREWRPCRRRSVRDIRGFRGPSGSRAGSRAHRARLRCGGRSSRRRIAVGGAEGAYGFAGGPGIAGGGFVERDGIEPGFALEGAAVGDGEEDLVLGAGGGEFEGDAGPGAGAAEGCGVDVEGHGGHGESGAGGDGRAAGIADGEVLGADPAGEFVALADGEGDGGGFDEGVGILAAGLDAEGAGRGAVDGGVGGGGAVENGEVIEGRLVDGGCGGRGNGREEEGETRMEPPDWYRISGRNAFELVLGVWGRFGEVLGGWRGSGFLGSAWVILGSATTDLLQGKDFLGSFGIARVVGVSNMQVSGGRRIVPSVSRVGAGSGADGWRGG